MVRYWDVNIPRGPVLFIEASGGRWARRCDVRRLEAALRKAECKLEGLRAIVRKLEATLEEVEEDVRMV